VNSTYPIVDILKKEKLLKLDRSLAEIEKITFL